MQLDLHFSNAESRQAYDALEALRTILRERSIHGKLVDRKSEPFQLTENQISIVFADNQVRLLAVTLASWLQTILSSRSIFNEAFKVTIANEFAEQLILSKESLIDQASLENFIMGHDGGPK